MAGFQIYGFLPQEKFLNDISKLNSEENYEKKTIMKSFYFWKVDM